MAYREEDSETFIREMGWDFRVSGSQFEMDCPLCGKKKKFYIAQNKPLFQCKVCDESGNLYQLRGKIGVGQIKRAADHVQPEDKPKEPIEQARIDAGKKRLAENKEAWSYLTETRGFDPKIIEGMSIILEEAYDARWIGFPWRYQGKWQGMKFRIIDSDRRKRVVDGVEKDALPRFRREAGYRSILYNRDVLDLTDEQGKKKFTRVVLCSGETDLLSLYSMGYRGVVATTTGETAMPDHEINELRKLDRVWVLYDNDKVGRESAKKIARRIGLDRAWIVRLPDEIKDANEFMRKRGKHAKKEMDALMREAFRPNVPTVQQVTEVVDRIKEGFVRDAQDIDKLTPWNALNKHLAQLKGLIVLSAPQGTGKTTFGLNLAAYWAKVRHAPSLFYCMEMSAAELVTKTILSEFMLTIEAETGNWQDRDGFGVDRDAILREFSITWENTPYYVGYSGVAKQPKEIIELLRQAVERYELQIVFFDNVHVFRGDDRVQRIGEFSAACKALSMELDIPVVLIAQPKKMDLGRMMNPWDLAYSSDLYSDADNMIFLHRQQIAAQKDTEVFREEAPEANYSPFTVVRVAKSRFGAGRDVLIYLEGASHHFRDARSDERIEFRGPRGGARSTTVGAVWGTGEPQPNDNGVEERSGKDSSANEPRDENLPF